MAESRSLASHSRDWWIALGGRNALSVWSWLFPTVAAIALAVAYEVPAFDYRLGPRVALVVVVQVALIPVMVLGYTVMRRLSAPRPVVGLAVFIVIGLARGVIIDVLAPFIEPVARDSLVYQLALNATYALLTLPFIAVVVDAVRRHRELRARVLAEGVRWERALRDAERAFAHEFTRYREQVDTEVTVRVVHLQDEIASLAREAAGEGAEASADELRRLSAEVVRPLSHELILEPTAVRISPAALPEVPPRVGLRDLLREAPRTPLAGQWAVCLVLGLFGLVALSYFDSGALLAANMGWNLVIFGLIPVLIAGSIRPLWARLPVGWAWAASLGLWVVMGCVAVLGTAELMSRLLGTAIIYWGAVVVYVALSALSVIALAGFRRQTELDIELNRILEQQEVLASRLMQRVDDERRELGLVLHGAVQSNLTRAAMDLERWGKAKDPATLPQVIADVRRVLDMVVGAFDVGLASRGDLTEIVHDRLRLWEGAVACECSIDEGADEAADAAVARGVGDVVGEAVTNAVRHGQANRVDVRIDLEGEWIVVRVRDDGVGPVGSRRPGAGLGHLARVGLAWDLDRVGDRTQLTVRLPAVKDYVVETEQSAPARTAIA